LSHAVWIRRDPDVGVENAPERWRGHPQRLVAGGRYRNAARYDELASQGWQQVAGQGRDDARSTCGTTPAGSKPERSTSPARLSLPAIRALQAEERSREASARQLAKTFTFAGTSVRGEGFSDGMPSHTGIRSAFDPATAPTEHFIRELSSVTALNWRGA
jgi:hypothetical protein